MTIANITEDIKTLLHELHTKKVAHLRARNIDRLQDAPCSLYDKGTHKVVATFASRAELWAFLTTTYTPSVIAERVAELRAKKPKKVKTLHEEYTE